MRNFVIVFILVIVAVAAVCGIDNMPDRQEKSIVEEYCATVYSSSVIEYKQCKELEATSILVQLKEQHTKKFELPVLPPIPKR